MAKKGKKYNNAKSLIEKEEYALEEAVSLLRKISFVQIDESVDIAMRLGVDPKHSDQMVRGTVVLPSGSGKTVRVCVIAGGEKV
ncbi:MAG: 50S ribosomal protein L1, partial [Candidatus Aminicenantes bacterium]|nr:50S ribosomal protein L1 [Candidatus Aminicenantes bacterium]